MSSSVRLALAALLAPLALAACGPRMVETRRPAASPTPATPAPATTNTPAATPEVPAGTASWSVMWQPGFSEYVVTSAAAVRVEGDTTAPGGVRDDSVATRARVSMRVSPANAPLGVLVQVDSFLVSPKRGAPMMPAIVVPLAFQAQLDEPRRRIEFLAEQPMLGAPCASPAASLLAVVRDLAPALPTPLPRGFRWSETTTHQLCRSGVPLTVTSQHEWLVDGEAQVNGMTLVRLRRETQSTIAGTGSGRRAGASVEGTSKATAEYLLDPAAGRLHSATATSSAELRVRERADAAPITTRQDARQDVTLQAPAAQ
jgi:hypothetical protein